MPDTQHCPKCGAKLAPGILGSACPNCMLQVAFDVREPEITENTQIGRYKLLEKIGEGGLGVVYMAEQQEPFRRKVAVKLIKPGMDSREVIARFEAERQALALMAHPNIATIYDAGATESGRPYFVMELVRGLRITDYCDRNNLSTRERLDLFVTIAQAVQHAHQKGIIHRDLKPSNILVTVNDGLPVPKIIDFGIAKATHQPLTEKTLFTRFHQLLGTPAYMSPEQAEMTSLDIDTRTDIYSLGVLLYELLTGRPPFESKELLKAGLERMLRTIRETEPARPSARLSTLTQADLTTVARQRQTEPPKLIKLIRGDLDWIVMKCLEKDRARRYETAASLAEDIQRLLGYEPVLARPPGASYRLQKFIMRHKKMVAAAGAVGLTLLLGVAVSLWQARIARMNYDRLAIAMAENELIAQAVTFSERGSILVDKGAKIYFVHYTADGETNTAEFGENTWLTASNSSNRLAELGSLTSSHRAPDGKSLAVGNASGVVLIRDTRTGQPRAPSLLHDRPINAVRFSPDSRWVATGCSDTKLRVWEVHSGRLIAGPFDVDGSAVVGLRFTENGKHLVAITAQNTLIVRDVATWRLRESRRVKINAPTIHVAK